MALFGKNQTSLTTRNQNPLSVWQREMNSLFDRFNQDFGSFGTGLSDFSPRIEVKDRDKSYIVCAEVPGIKENDIDITLKDNCLVLEGERKTESKEEEEGYYRSEFSYGNFYRTIPLNDEVDPDSVKASYKDGILTVEMQKLNPAQHQAKKIPIMKS